MISEQMYRRLMKAQEAALRIASNPAFYQDAMRGYARIQALLKEWDRQQLMTTHK